MLAQKENLKRKKKKLIIITISIHHWYNGYFTSISACEVGVGGGGGVARVGVQVSKKKLHTHIYT